MPLMLGLHMGPAGAFTGGGPGTAGQPPPTTQLSERLALVPDI